MIHQNQHRQIRSITLPHHFTFPYFLLPHNAQPLRTAQGLKGHPPQIKHSFCQNRRRRTAAAGTYIVQDRGRKQRHSQDLVNLVVREKHRTAIRIIESAVIAMSSGILKFCFIIVLFQQKLRAAHQNPETYKKAHFSKHQKEILFQKQHPPQEISILSSGTSPSETTNSMILRISCFSRSSAIVSIICEAW